LLINILVEHLDNYLERKHQIQRYHLNKGYLLGQ
jgi:spore coat protein CotF